MFPISSRFVSAVRLPSSGGIEPASRTNHSKLAGGKHTLYEITPAYTKNTPTHGYLFEQPIWDRKKKDLNALLGLATATTRQKYVLITEVLSLSSVTLQVAPHRSFEFFRREGVESHPIGVGVIFSKLNTFIW